MRTDGFPYNLILQSTSFQDGGEIPKKHGYKNGNVRPHLKISHVPSGAKSLVIIMDDPDAMGAVGRLWVHWTAWNIDPKTAEIAESLPKGAVEGVTDFGTAGYGGPAPPDKRHTYVFKMYALNSELSLGSSATKRQLEDAMEDHIIAQTSLSGTYAPQ